MNLVFDEWIYDRIMVSPKGSQFPPLATQGSVYNLTFDEVQSQLGNIGKPLNSMNLNELVKNMVSVDEGNHHHQLPQNPSSSSSSSSPPASCLLGNFNLNGRLSKKTVDEVWKEIVHHDQHVNNEVDNHYNNNNQTVQQMMTLGETTLEDFLLRAGVINHPQQPLMAFDPMVVMSTQQTDWLHFQMHQQQQQMSVMDADFNVSESAYENPSVVDIGYSENHHQMAMSMTMPVAAIPATPSDSKMAGEKKRGYSDEMMEKTIERRQKRMIKNRESAARSRARKQAYTNQLELEVFQLRKTNSWLKKQKEVEMLLSSHPTSMPKYQLRRTSSI
ncbi:ABSCISIC ACID-INSENSITIVE 5-like protein 3 [Pistacia vera]|uniref:ABSCISIC ACID-INSENSITIVE 5-like protein 3 n=1 Tax=Pistacia vera TaxID=55513 RepID=UPI0012634CFE|nr:ABSCISIC ACID-INSENSITIVE 5-like protein 3 [Pistacia vera]